MHAGTEVQQEIARLDTPACIAVGICSGCVGKNLRRVGSLHRSPARMALDIHWSTESKLKDGTMRVNKESI